MAHPFDPAKIGQDIVDALNGILQDDVARYVDFAERQSAGLAKQAAWIAEATIAGEIDADDRQWFLENLEKMTENFARVVVGLTLLTIEKAWNAIVDVLWGAVNSALKAASVPIKIPVPAAPAP